MTKKEPAPKRGFKGLFIPRNIYLSPELKPMEKMLLGEIDALDDEVDGCYASNAHFSDFLGVTERYVRKMVSHLFSLGLVDVNGRGGRRIIRIDQKGVSGFNPAKKTRTKAELQFRKSGTTVPKFRNHSSPVVDSREYNERSTTVERREGRDASASASSFDSSQGRGDSRGAVQKAAFNIGAAIEQPQTNPERAGTPKGAPWAGKSYANRRRDQLPKIESYEDIWGLAADPVLAAMATTGETMSGGYGFWIKWLNSAAAKKGLETAVEFFMGCLTETWGEVSIDGIKNPAAVFNNKLKSTVEVAA